jgi:hypothetical protein
MKKMLQITSAALFVSFISFPSSLSAQTLSNANEGFQVTGPMMGIAGIAVVLVVALAFSIIDSKKEVSQA